MIEIQSHTQASLQRTWDAYTQPEHIVNWNFASEDWECPWAKSDLRAGGRYVARMAARDGSMGFDLGATFTTVEQPHRLEMSLDDQRRVVVLFTHEPQGTRVHVSFDAENENPTDLQRMGWQAILDRFCRYADTL
ncbi:MAG TPA: SRPBCC domain-containing protein [Luteibaculaceae bacterium]|nr:SRPBCC domain-containing protein [Luteibaculaceae bacterium]